MAIRYLAVWLFKDTLIVAGALKTPSQPAMENTDLCEFQAILAYKFWASQGHMVNTSLKTTNTNKKFYKHIYKLKSRPSCA